MHPSVIPRITTSPASNKDTDSTSAQSDVQFGSEDPAPNSLKSLEENEVQAQHGSITDTAPSHEEDQTPGDTPVSNGVDVQATPRMSPRTTKSPEDSPTDRLSPTVRSARPTASTTTRVTTTRMLHHRGYSLDLPNGDDAPGGSSAISEGFVSPSGSMRSRRTWAAGETYEARRLERNLSALSFQSAATASPLDFHDLVQIYEIVASRRAAFDNLLWSVPSTSFAGKSVEQQGLDQIKKCPKAEFIIRITLFSIPAQAFLFQIALGGDSSRSARIISMCLSILISFLTLQLFTRQLQAEAADHAWLEDWEMRHNVTPSDRAHGETWRGYREILPVRAGIYAPLAKFRGFSLWSHGMVVIGMVAVGVLVASAINGKAFENCSGDGGIGNH